ncbi:ABC transporter permease [Dyella agri]|uniref:ABC transporter permease n=1 Tax=Dyella agri TaxID=1926869 RepID=A0ABW8KCD2_9GAMM
MTIWFAEVWRAWRASLRKPGFLLLATAVLALGVGASTTVLTLIDRVLLEPLPYPQASRLVQLGMEKFGVAYWVSPQEYQHAQHLQGVQSMGMVARFPASLNIAGDGEPELVPALYADRGLLPTLGIPLSLGRNFTAQEDQPHGPKAVILGHGFWMRRYGGDPGAVGRTMSIEGVPYAIVGVLPQHAGLSQGDLLLPVALPAGSTDDGSNYRAIGRLAPGVPAAAVGAELQVRMHAMLADSGALSGPDGAYWSRQQFRADALDTALQVRMRPVLTMFLASALLVLLLAMVNLANLMLLRMLARSHDAAVRDALGASWQRRAMPIAAEGLLVGVCGSLLGALLAMAALIAWRGLIPPDWLDGRPLPIDASIVLTALGLGLAGTVLAVALGLWRGLARTVSMEELREGGRSGMAQRGGLLGRVLVTAQVAIAACLLCAAGLFLHALYDAAHAPLGFRSQGVLTFDLAPVQANYPDAASVRDLDRRLLERFRAQPGVEQAAVGTGLPVGDYAQNFYLGNIRAPGGEPLADSPQFRGVGPEYFATFGIAVREGRGFLATDDKGSERVAVINQVLAERMYGGHALGKSIEFSSPAPGDGGHPFVARIVGVIGTISPFGPLGGKDGILYVPFSQVPDGLLDVYRSGNPLRFALRVEGNPEDYRKTLVAAVAQVAPNQPIAHVLTMQRIVRDTTGDTRMNLLLVGIFAALALVLAAVGMYAVVAVSVANREREFGVRLALGASPSRLAYIVLRGGLLQIAVGLAAGFALALLLSGMLGAVLMQIQRNVFDVPVLLAVCMVLAAAGLLACLLPALRAAHVPPMRALRGE